MRHRSKSLQPINLFAFLDILICTMGALILMLMVVTTRQLRKDSLAQVLAELKSPAPPVLSVESPLPASPSLLERTFIPAQPEAEPRPAEPSVDPREAARAERAAALAQREHELNELLAGWRQKVNELTTERDQHAKTLAQRQRLKEVAARQVTALQNEVKDLEVKLGSLTGELSTASMGDATEKERKLIEQQIAALQKRLKAAQVAAAGGNSKFMVVPFDTVSGTARRPILIECTAEGLRFIPEDVMIRPDDLEGFTPRVNPLVAGSNALVNYWTAWNLKQPQPAREPEPYVLLLVRPSGTVAYYVAMKMLADLKKPHGYELIEETTQLQVPELDAGAKAACEAAVKRLLAGRDQLKQSSGGGSGGTGFAARGASGGDAFRPAGGSSARRGEPNRFELTDVTDEDQEVGSHSWERIENFEGRNPRGASASRNDSVVTGSLGPGATQRQSGGDEHELDSHGLPIDGDDAESDKARRAVARRRDVEISTDTGSPAETRAGEVRPQGRIASGIERIDGQTGSDAAPSAAGASTGDGSSLTGLGSTSGASSVPVFDQRTKKKSSNSKPLEPEQLVRKRWGLSAPDAAIGLEREVQIDVEKDRLVVGGQHAIRMGEGDSKQETFERLVTVLDQQAREWGQSPQGFFWTPSLKFVVAEGANANYEQVHSLVERAGLTSTKEYTDGTREPKAAAPVVKPAAAPPAPKTGWFGRRVKP